MRSNWQGSIVLVTDNTGGNVLAINRYDEYGIPQSGGAGRFRYTGQVWLGELGIYYYKARMYSPSLGRFMQTDPIGYGDGMNWYNYVGGDPVNATDPTGTTTVCRLVDGGWRIWYRYENGDGIPQVNELVGKTMDQIAECTGESTLLGSMGLDFSITDIVVVGAKKVICPSSPVQVSIGADIYAFYGGSGSLGYSFDLRTGQYRLFAEGALGAGAGGGVGGSVGPGERESGVAYSSNVTGSYIPSGTVSAPVERFGALPNSLRDYSVSSAAAGVGPKLGLWANNSIKYTSRPTRQLYNTCGE